MPSKKKESNESKLIYIPFVAVVIIAAAFFVLPLLHSSSSTQTASSSNIQTVSLSTNKPFFQFAKVSNENYAGNDSVQVYFISWYGCPYGASDSWALYIALSKFGLLNVTPNYSDLEAIPSTTGTIEGKVPGLIFNSFVPKSNVYFHAIYLLGRIFPSNSTASLTNGTIISYSGNSLVNLELNELKKLAPSWVYNLVYEYQIQTVFPQGGAPIAYLGHPPHIASTIIITGPNGTWMLIGYDQQINPGAPGLLAQYASLSNYSPSVPEQLLQNIQEGTIPPSLEFIKQEANQISNIIQEAM